MKKISLGLLVSFVLIVAFYLVFIKNKENEDLTKITVAEVTHSIFYTPWYVAIENGYFEAEGIEIDLVLTSGADKVSAAVLSGDAQIGFAGPESSIYVYNGGEDDYIVSFAGLTKRDGQFIVARENIEDFQLEDMIGKEVLAGRVGGMPILNFQNALKKAEIDEKQIIINTSVEFAALSGSFIAEMGDFVNLFEPNATLIEQQGLGYVVASVGELSGEVPYTAFNTRKSYLENNPEIIKGFVNALNKGIKYTLENDVDKVAEVIAPQFPDSSIEEISIIIERYKNADSWYENTTINEKAFTNLEDIMIDAGLLEEYVPFNDLVVNIDYE